MGPGVEWAEDKKAQRNVSVVSVWSQAISENANLRILPAVVHIGEFNAEGPHLSELNVHMLGVSWTPCTPAPMHW